MKLRLPDLIALHTENGVTRVHGAAVAYEDVRACATLTDEVLTVTLTADTTPIRFVRLRWNFNEDQKRHEPVRILSERWERAYADMMWNPIQAERCMPWHFSVSNGSDANPDLCGRFTECFGVKVRPSAMCFWQYDTSGVTLWLDVRNGASGVLLGGRELKVCDVIFAEYRNDTAFHAVHAFCGLLCDDPVFAPHKVYGSNNWYYAYGNSSHEEIMRDTRLIAGLCQGFENPPYMVIDDGWQPNRCDAPWDRGNERFPDMKRLAQEMAAEGVRPGIWIRPLNDTRRETEGVLPEHRMSRCDDYLDPSHPAVLERVRTDIRRLADWGFRLIKHDFTTYDIFGQWGSQVSTTMAKGDWHFYDRSKTTAEIVLGLYRAIREAAGPDTVIIGCNVMGHLAAGLVHLNRTGDDTSGRFWEQTRHYGVNALAFHMIHNNTYYAADADCVGITENIDWEMNRRWLKALAVSGSPLFISCTPGILTEDQLAELRDALHRNSLQNDVLEPIDWMENACPDRWLLNGKEIRFDWYPENGCESFNG